MAGYAKGAHALGECQQCGFRFKLAQLRSDGQVPNLLVCRTCWDKKNEAEYPVNLSDATALYHPAPDLDAVNSRVIIDSTPIGELVFPNYATTEPFFGEH